MRQMLQSTLEEAGFQVCLAENGLKGLELASRDPFALVLTDYHMPEMDGVTLVRRLRALPDYRYAPILVLTTEGGPEIRREGKQAGATGWIVKPLNPLTLLATIRKVLD